MSHKRVLFEMYEREREKESRVRKSLSLVEGLFRRSVADSRPRKKNGRDKNEKKMTMATTATTSAAKPTLSAHAAPAATAGVAPLRDVSIAIVKASQREHVLSRLWPEFVKVREIENEGKLIVSPAATASAFSSFQPRPPPPPAAAPLTHPFLF